MVDLTNMDSHHGSGTVQLMDSMLASSSASAKLNGSLHHRHIHNASVVSASSKHSAAGISGSGVGGLGSSAEAKAAAITDHLNHSRAELNVPPDLPVLPLHSLQLPTHHPHRRHVSVVCSLQRPLLEMMGCLAILAIVSILLAFLATVFFLRITPITSIDGQSSSGSGNKERIFGSKEYSLVYEVVLGLTMCTISLDFSCFLVCAAQLLFAAKLSKISNGDNKAYRYLQRGAFTRSISVCGFFISIPVFLTGIILYAFIQFHAISAIVTGALLGIGIIFSGIAMIHNVYLWQHEQAREVPHDNDHGKDHHLADNSFRSVNLTPTQVPYMELSTLV